MAGDSAAHQTGCSRVCNNDPLNAGKPQDLTPLSFLFLNGFLYSERHLNLARAGTEIRNDGG